MRIALLVLAGCAGSRPPAPAPPRARPCTAHATVTVRGGVRAPGSIACTPGMRVADAVNAAGGFTELAWRDRTRLRRGTRTYAVGLDVMLTDEDEILVREHVGY